MKLKFINIASGLIMLLASFSAHALCFQKVKYINQRGSILELCYHKNYKQDYAGNLSGTFISAVGNCEANMNKKMPISGFFNYNAIAVTINFPDCKQVVAMTGTVADDELHTIWLDASKAEDPTTKNWNSNIVGADSYKKTK